MAPDTATATGAGVDARHGHEVDRMRRQVQVMLGYALDKGLAPAPEAWMFDAVREMPLVDLSAEGWSPLQESGRRHGTEALVQAHRELSRLVAPAQPASLELLQSYREGRRPGRTVRIPRQKGRPGAVGPTGPAPGKAPMTLRRPRPFGIGSSVPVVRWLTVAALVFLALFVGFAASPDARTAVGGSAAPDAPAPAAPAQPPAAPPAASAVPTATSDAVVPDSPDAVTSDSGTAGPAPTTVPPPATTAPAATTAGGTGSSAASTSSDETFGSLLLRELFLLSAAGLGASLVGLYRAGREVSRGTYDPESDHLYVQRIVLGMAAGLLLAELVPLPGEPGSPVAVLGPPAIALVGGFAASVVHRILSRVVSALEALFSGDPEEQEETRRALAQKRADEVLAQAERATLAKLLEIRRVAASGAPTRAVVDEIDQMITHVSPG